MPSCVLPRSSDIEVRKPQGLAAAVIPSVNGFSSSSLEAYPKNSVQIRVATRPTAGLAFELTNNLRPGSNST